MFPREITVNRFKRKAVTVYNNCYETTSKEIREIKLRRIDTNRGKFRNLMENFWYAYVHRKDSSKCLKAEDQESDEKEKSPVELSL